LDIETVTNEKAIQLSNESININELIFLLFRNIMIILLYKLISSK